MPMPTPTLATGRGSAAESGTEGSSAVAPSPNAGPPSTEASELKRMVRWRTDETHVNRR